MPISYKLKSGDQVEILTSNALRVEPSWRNFVTTAKAKNKVETILRRQRREQQKKGEEMLEQWCADNELELNSQLLDRLAMYHLLETREEFYASLGAGNIVLGEEDLQALRSDKDKRSRSQGWTRYLPFYKRKRDAEPEKEKAHKDEQEQPVLVIDRKKPLYLSEENIGRVSMCEVCNPIPGDEVLGYLDNQNRVIVHKRNCSVANRLKNVDGNKILAVFWDTHKQMSFAATLHMEGIDRVGIIKSLTDVITEQLNVNVHQLSIAAREGIFQGDIELGVHDTEDLEVIISNLRKIDGIEEVKRVM